MEFWSDLSGGVKTMIAVGVLLSLSMFGYRACTTPTAEDERINEAKRSVN
ncbi:MAG: hypothetical protein OXU20_19560 [Myxococcales bacterium]|nr:hypothetical protein [Myxococcales bacterium]MDD9965843.1 hypothetical protein [Myxococcales bacterium]